MSLQFITGNSGNGKTKYLFNRIVKEAKANPRDNYLVIVPEQFTMQTQRQLVDLSENKAIMNIDVLSFKRLAYRVFDELGITNLTVLEETGKNLVLRKLAAQEADKLGVIGRNLNRIGYISEVKSLLSELVQYNISPEELGRYIASGRLSDTLSDKLKDVLVLYEAFEKFMQDKYITAEEILNVLSNVVHEPHSIPELTYKEMRELAYAGFSVLHDEALLPAYRGKIPLVIKNTNNPDHPGTRIILEHQGATVPVVGIASDDKFVSINMSKYLMNREVGFGRKVLQILEDLNIRWEHMPSGIDDLSIIIRERELTPIKEQEILSYLTRELGVDEVEIEHGLSILVIVGENMRDHIGVTATAAKALSEKNINLEMISQGSSEVSVMFVIETEQEKEAVRALYDAFFRSNN